MFFCDIISGNDEIKHKYSQCARNNWLESILSQTMSELILNRLVRSDYFGRRDR